MHSDFSMHSDFPHACEWVGVLFVMISVGDYYLFIYYYLSAGVYVMVVRTLCLQVCM